MSTNTKHPHDAVIRSWLDGRVVETYLGGSWREVFPVEKSFVTSPSFGHEMEYRIKPETIRYRVALFGKGGKFWTNSYSPAHYAEVEANEDGYFIRWLGDEQEVEV